jgi:hypothetical protein
MIKKIWPIFFVMMINFAYADNVRLGASRYAGSGCPEGSASVTLSPDLKYISLIFDSYVAESGVSNRRPVDHKTCDFLIPIHLPAGLALSIVAIDYRGYVLLPDNSSSAKFFVKYFLAGAMGAPFVKNWSGPIDSDYVFENNLAVSNRVHSACGGDVEMRVSSTMSVKNARRVADALASVDSGDIEAGLTYKLEFKRCL